MGTMIEENGKMRELVKVKSDNPTHAGYFTTYRDQMKSGDEEYQEPGAEGEEPEPLTVAQIKEKLAELEIEIPAGVTKKVDLQALLDKATKPEE